MKHVYFLSKMMLLPLVTLLSSFLGNCYAQQVARSTTGTTVTNCGGYYEYLPPSYASGTANFPLIIFIHGIDELGNGTTSLPNVLKNGIPKLINNGTFPESFTVNGQTSAFVVLSPQFKAPPSPLDVQSLINYIKTVRRIDNNRIYITGLSMGGGATEDFASANDAFAQIAAAVVPVSGNLDPKQFPARPGIIAKNKLPMWFFHNDGDGTVPSQYTKDWVAGINASNPAPNPPARMTIFAASGHDAWSKAYDPAYKENNMNVYEWMLQYSKGGTVPPPPSGNKKVIAKNNIGNGMYYTDAMTSFGLNPGDTLCIPAGDYEFIQLGKLVGTAAKPIIITNCGGQVRLGINTHKSDIAFNIMSGKFLEISGSGTPGIEYGFDINGMNLDGVQMQGMYFGSGSTDFNVHNMYIHDANILIVAKTTQSCEFPEYWEGAYVMRNAKIHHIKGRNAEYEGFYIGNTHYILNFPDCAGDIKSHHLENLEVYDNDIQNTGYDAIQIAMADMGENKIYNNVVRNYGTQNLDAQSYGLLMGGGTAVKVFNNIVDQGYLPGIALFGSGVSYVYNNVISNITNGEGINVSDKLILQPVTAYIYNNTIYNTGPNGIKIYAYLTTLGHKVYNNLVINTGSTGDYPQSGYYIRGAQTIKFDFANNFFSKTPADAKVVDGASGNFRLAVGAPAIDAGRDMSDLGLNTDEDGHIRPVNGKFDGGAYEYSGAAPQKPPVSKPGANIAITLPVNTVSLDGTGSTTPNGSITAYSWKKLSGPATGTITSSDAAKTTVTGLTEGVYVFELTVTDNLNLSAKANVTVTVNAGANNMPVANAGANTTISLPVTTTTLDGSGSTDADGTITTYAWKQVSGPGTSVIATPAAVTTGVSALVAGTYIFELTVTDNKNATATARVTITVNPVTNKPPVANAGNDAAVTLPVSSIVLNGAASSDPDGTIASYLWQKLSGPADVVFSDETAVRNTVTQLIAGTYVFRLIVKDNRGASAQSDVTVTVNPAAVNQAPVANAGNGTTIQLPVNSVQLDGTASTDPDGTIAKYEWKKTAGPNSLVITTPSAATTNVTGLTAGTYTFQLTVTDDKGAVDVATVQVIVEAAIHVNQPPVANAGGATTIQLPVSTVSLDGSASADPDGIIATYEWTKTAGPAGAVIATPAAATTNITGLTEGTYTFQLTVTDDKDATSTATVNVTVNAAAPVNQPPVANAGGATTIQLPVNSVSLDGSASTDPDGTIATYAWIKTAGPNDVVIATPSGTTTNITGLVAGTYTFQLTVTDDKGATSTASVNVTVKAAAPVNQPPVANAGGAVTVQLPVNSVSLNGSASTDPDGTIEKYAWTKTAGPNDVVIATPSSTTTNITGLIEGTYTFQLTVTDDKGATSTANVSVTVNAAVPVNQPPVANAGGAITIQLPVNSASLDGSASTDPDGTIAKYVWTKTAGPAGAVITTPSGTVTNITGLVQGNYTFQLTVTDDKGATSTASVNVTVNAAAPENEPPVANAGGAITIQLPVSTASLNGSASTDPDGTIAKYAWTKTAGPAGAVIATPSGTTTNVTGLTEGTYTFQLTVTDDKGATATASVNVTVSAAIPDNKLPVAVVKADKTVVLPTIYANADGSTSYDTDGSVVSYLWEQVSGPEEAQIATPNAARTLLLRLQEGTYVFKLTVTDDRKGTNTTTFTVVVSPDPQDDHLSDSIVFLPNPVITAAKLQVHRKGENVVHVRIFDMNGRQMSDAVFSFNNVLQTEINVTNIPSGHYIIQVTGDNKKWSKRFVKIAN